jgi:hypothetical protein
MWGEKLDVMKTEREEFFLFGLSNLGGLRGQSVEKT